MKKNVAWTLVTVFLTLCISFAANGLASPAPTVAVDPPEVKDLRLGESFTVNLVVSDIVISDIPLSNGLYGWNLKVTFDPTILNAANVTEGPFLQQVAETVPLPVRINNTEGYTYIGSMLDIPWGPQGATGSGVLATITFTVVGHGSTKLELERLRVELFTATFSPPPTRPLKITNVTAIDGEFANAAAFPIELIVGVVGAAAIGGTLAAFFYKRRKTPT